MPINDNKKRSERQLGRVSYSTSQHCQATPLIPQQKYEREMIPGNAVGEESPKADAKGITIRRGWTPQLECLLSLMVFFD